MVGLAEPLVLSALLAAIPPLARHCSPPMEVWAVMVLLVLPSALVGLAEPLLLVAPKVGRRAGRMGKAAALMLV